MKRLYRNLIFFSLSGLICLFLAVPASAQHRGGGGHGGGGGGHFSSGGGGHYSSGRSFSGGGHAAYSSRGAVRSYASRGNVSARYGNRAYAGRAGVNAYSRGGYGARGGAYARGGYGRGYGGRGYAYRGYGYGGRFGYGGFHYYRGFYGSLYFPHIGWGIGFLPYGYYPFYWGDYEYYYSNGFFYQYDNNEYTIVEPPVGAQVNSLPANAQSIVIDGQQYYEADGVYYVAITKDDGSLAYQVAGKDGELNTGGGQQYNDQGYNAPPAGNYDQGNNPPPAGNYNQGNVAPTPPSAEDAAPANAQPTSTAGIQLGDLVQTLPPDSRGVTVNGTRMFVSPDDVYFQETRDNNNHKAYKVVGLPSEQPNN